MAEVSWKKENSLLEDDANSISRLKKEINKETEVDSSLQFNINLKIEDLKHSATTLANRLEQEKHKNLELELIIKHIKCKMENDKLIDATHRDDLNFENLNSLENKIKKFEYDLSQISSRANRIYESVSVKRVKINQTRTERVIDSGIFRNIEKELRDSELMFKKLLIEKIKHEKEYEKLNSEYSDLKEKVIEIQPGKDTNKTKSVISSVEGGNAGNKFTQLRSEQTSNHQIKSLSNHKQALSPLDEESLVERHRKEYVLKKIYLNTGIQSAESLLHLLQGIDHINSTYFDQMNAQSDQVAHLLSLQASQIEKLIQQTSHSKAALQIKFYEKKASLSKSESKLVRCQDLRNTINSIDACIEEELQLFSDLVVGEDLTKLLAELDISQLPFAHIDLGEFDSIQTLFQIIESKLTSLLAPKDITKCDSEEKEQGDFTGRTNKEEKLNDLIGKLKKYQECQKVMHKEDFQEEYRKMVRNQSQKNTTVTVQKKKKSLGNGKR